MQTKTIAITGSRGLIGHPLCQQLQEKHRVIPMDISDETRPVDITDYNVLAQAVAQTQPDVVIHLAAFTDVTAAWMQQGDKQGLAYTINVTGTENLVRACAGTQSHILHLSTAYVFNGEKDTPYTEADEPHPIEWYGTTKALAEEAVSRYDTSWTILRIDQPFHHLPSPTKPDLAHNLIQKMDEKQLPPQFTDHYFGPTYIPDLITTIEKVIDSSTYGLFHATNNESWTNYDFAQAVARTIDYHGTIESGTLAEYLKTSQRPYQKNTALNSELLISTLGLKPRTITAALEKLVRA